MALLIIQYFLGTLTFLDALSALSRKKYKAAVCLVVCTALLVPIIRWNLPLYDEKYRFLLTILVAPLLFVVGEHMFDKSYYERVYRYIRYELLKNVSNMSEKEGIELMSRCTLVDSRIEQKSISGRIICEKASMCDEDNVKKISKGFKSSYKEYDTYYLSFYLSEEAYKLGTPKAIVKMSVNDKLGTKTRFL
jgi:hypothetical protein